MEEPQKPFFFCFFPSETQPFALRLPKAAAQSLGAMAEVVETSETWVFDDVMGASTRAYKGFRFCFLFFWFLGSFHGFPVFFSPRFLLFYSGFGWFVQKVFRWFLIGFSIRWPYDFAFWEKVKS